MLRGMFKKTWQGEPERKSTGVEIPEGLWRKCNHCGRPIYSEDVKSHHYICPRCGGYFRVHAMRRIEMLADDGSFVQWDDTMPVSNPLSFPGYEKKLEANREKTGLNEAVVTGKIRIMGYPTAIGICDSRFMMSSMGHVVGEKVTRLFERATEENLPVILFTASGGARMQEGIISLMQMAKTSAAIKRHHDSGNLYVTVLTNPTTGGVTASFAMLGDIILAEPKALIGFAGPRVIEQTIRQKLPEGFQSSEFLLEHGFVDRIVPRERQKEELAAILKLHDRKAAEYVKELNDFPSESMYCLSSSPKMDAWTRVQLSRAIDRPTALDYIHGMFDDFIELHGDRLFGDDGAVVGGIASFFGKAVTVIGIQKGRNIKENKIRNFGMPSPEGYRKALRLMQQAEAFGRPVICFVDTPGAYCGLSAEERGQGEAIARNLYEMSGLNVPILSIVIGEGGSGGALALAVSDEVWMLENSIYSILSPEGFAAILFKDAGKAEQAAGQMKLTAQDLYDLHVIEKVIREPEDFSVENAAVVYSCIKPEILRFLKTYTEMPKERLVENRYQRFRKF